MSDPGVYVSYTFQDTPLREFVEVKIQKWPSVAILVFLEEI
jgi:hypothetical protein